MPLRNKYSVEQWITDRENLVIGDTVAYYSEEEQKEVISEVISFPSQTFTQYISCRRVNDETTEVVNIYNTIVYKVAAQSRSVSSTRECSCGARFTSNPNYHLNYCDLSIRKLA